MKARFSVASALLAVLATIGVGAGAALAVQGARGHAAAGTRAWREHVTAPAQFDLTLAEISFPAPRRSTRPAPSRPPPIRLRPRGAIGLDYLAAAVVRSHGRGRPRMLVLVVNRRPRGSLAPDLARIGVTLTAPSRFGRPRVWQITNPFTRTSALTPALCDLPLHGAALAAGALRSILGRGSGLTGFSAAQAVAQAYNVVCRRPYDPAFAQAVTQGASPPCQTSSSVPCCAPNAVCAPPPCPPCPCGAGPCVAEPQGARAAVIPCPLASPPVACPL